MNPRLRIALIHIAIALCLLGCDRGEIGMGVCRHEATYCLTVAGEKYPVRIAAGTRNGGNHVQAQAYMGDAWVYLSMTSRGGVYATAPDKTFVVTHHYHPWVWFALMNEWMVKENKMK